MNCKFNISPINTEHIKIRTSAFVASSDYNDLLNLPSLGGITIQGDMAYADLFLGKTNINTKAYWDSHDITPELGEIIIYLDRETINNVSYPGVKVGNGTTILNNLPFIGDNIASQILVDLSNKADKNNPIFTGSISLGRKNNATTGDKSVAIGQNVEASGLSSFAIGDSTIANHKDQYVFGANNVQDSSNTASSVHGTYIEIVGNGTSNLRSNARALDWNGNEYLAGDVYVNCENSSTGGTKLATIADIPAVATIQETQEIITEYEVST